MANSACSVFLEKKKRRCSFPAHAANGFCAFHQPEGKVPCPLDPAHLVDAKSVDRHVRACNARAQPLPIYYAAGINLAPGFDEAQAHTDRTLRLSSIPAPELRDLLARVGAAMATLGRSHEAAVAAVEAVDRRAHAAIGTTDRHLRQISSLVGHMRDAGLLSSGRCFVELGAGRGQLLAQVHRAVRHDTPALEAEPTQYLAVDRGTARGKLDHQIRGECDFSRVRIDIEHLNLAAVPLVAASQCPVVACGKHLCGAGTDLSLICLANVESARPGAVAGVCIALCCHYHCDWARYVNRPFFEALGFTPRDFHLLTLVLGTVLF